MSQKCYSGENTAGGATEAVRQKASLRGVSGKGMADDSMGSDFSQAAAAASRSTELTAPPRFH